MAVMPDAYRAAADVTFSGAVALASNHSTVVRRPAGNGWAAADGNNDWSCRLSAWECRTSPGRGWTKCRAIGLARMVSNSSSTVIRSVRTPKARFTGCGELTERRTASSSTAQTVSM
jgi:hypothetical protein